MAVISGIAANAWSATVTLTAPEFWQVRVGPVYLATAAATAPEDLTDGLLLAEGDVVALESGEVVRYRSATGAATASLVRRARA
jgi:hypothetical protein